MRVTHVVGLATCLVCATLVSWKRSWQQLDEVTSLTCPLCKGACVVHPSSSVSVIARGRAAKVVE